MAGLGGKGLSELETIFHMPTLLGIYNSLVQPHFDYSIGLFHGTLEFFRGTGTYLIRAGIFQQYIPSLGFEAEIPQGFRFLRLGFFMVQVFQAGIPQGFRFLRLEFFRGSGF